MDYLGNSKATCWRVFTQYGSRSLVAVAVWSVAIACNDVPIEPPLTPTGPSPIVACDEGAATCADGSTNPYDS